MQTPNPYPALFSSFRLGARTLKNRIVHLAMNTHMAARTRVTDRLIAYHAARARGGAALIVTEPISMARHQNVSYRARAWNDDNLDGLERWAEAVESEGCALLAQVQDPGRGRHNTGIGAHAIGASALPDDLSWTVPHALAADEIAAMIDDFAASCARLQRCGFTGVEISAGHGHLFHQFLSPWSNVRTDRYGGDWEGRTRFVRELIEAIRATCARAFLIGLKLPGSDYQPGGIGPAEAAIVASMLTASRDVDYVCFAQGTHGLALERHLPDAHAGDLPHLEPIACVNNPRVAEPDEADWRPAAAAVKRRVVVIGAGIAGLEAAWIAAARGHAVTVFGRSQEVGGKARLHAQLPGSATLARIYDYQYRAARKAGARFELGVEASVDTARAMDPHVVVLATGARMLAPPGMPVESKPSADLANAIRAILADPRPCAGSAVLFDMDHTEGTYAAAELMRAVFDRVFVLTPREYIAQKVALVTRQGILRRFHEKRIDVIPLVQPRWTESRAGTLEYANVYSGAIDRIVDVAFVAYSTPRIPDDALAAPLRALGMDVRPIGDCALPQGLLAATAAGYAAGMEL